MNAEAFVLTFYNALWSKAGPTDAPGVQATTIKSVLMAIALKSDYMTGQNSCPSIAYIQDATGIGSNNSVSKAIKAAIDQGWLIRTKGNPYSKRGYTYQVVIPRRDDGNAVAEQPKQDPTPQPTPSADQDQPVSDPQPVNPVVDPADEPAQQGAASPADEPPPTEQDTDDPTLMPVAQRAQDIVSDVAAKMRIRLSIFELQSLTYQLVERGVLDGHDDEVFISAIEGEAMDKAGRIKSPFQCLKFAIKDFKVVPYSQRCAVNEVEVIDEGDQINWDLVTGGAR